MKVLPSTPHGRAHSLPGPCECSALTLTSQAGEVPLGLGTRQRTVKGTHRPTDVPDGRLHAPSQSACLNPTPLCGCRRSPKGPRVDGSTFLAASSKLTARASALLASPRPPPSSALRALLQLPSALLRTSSSPAHRTSACHWSPSARPLHSHTPKHCRRWQVLPAVYSGISGLLC